MTSLFGSALLLMTVGLISLSAATASSPALPSSARSQSQVEFNREIRPILSDKCFQCHGFDKNARKAQLRLDIRDNALKGGKSGKAAIVPGNPNESEVARRIVSSDPDEKMPPEDSPKKLSDREKDLLRRWIAQGAKYEGHWAFLPIQRPSVPSFRLNARTPDEGSQPSISRRQAKPSAGNVIDRFIRARLQKEGLRPAPEADRPTLIRRVFLDLQGLPPAPERVEQFVQSKDPAAYEKLVDELLGSPEYAERMTMEWLDLVRYGDSTGFHADVAISLWPYRDYVLDAFRKNLPFDQFTREQLGGDLIPNATDRQKTASTYNRLNRITNEGGAQDKEYLAKYAADRVRTTSTVWMGATMGCCECHDHKFDPFATRDFYNFEAFFADLDEQGYYGGGSGNDGWGPKLLLPTPDQKDRLAQLDTAIQRKEAAVAATKNEALAQGRAAWESRILELEKAGKLGWTAQKPLTVRSQNGATLTINSDQTVRVGGLNPDQEIYTIECKPGEGRWTALRLQTLSGDEFPGNGIARSGITFMVSGVDMQIDDQAGSRMADFEYVRVDREGEGTPGLAMLDADPNTAWGAAGHGGDHFAVFYLRRPLTTSTQTTLKIQIRHESAFPRTTIGAFRLALATIDRPNRSQAMAPDDVLKSLKLPSSERKDEDRKRIEDYYRTIAPELWTESIQLADLRAQRSIIAGKVASTLVSATRKEPRTIRVLPRGNWMDETGAIAQPAAPESLGSLGIEGRRATRLDLANWLCSTNNPMTARAVMNRLWKQFFGTGLSKVVNDLGSQGEWPTHPELLDWMAAEFMQPTIPDARPGVAPGPKSWDLQHMVRLIVTSDTYCQSSLSRPELDDRDPENRLLARQSRFRVEAEIVHDNALSISGLLVTRFGGPSVNPYQPDGYWASLNFPHREYVDSVGDDLYRRGLYTHWQRTFLHPSLAAFDAPSREECTANRVLSNTPLQALVLLNDPIYEEAARIFAEHALRRGGTALEDRIRWAWRRALARPPRPDELKILTSLHGEQLTRYSRDPDAAQEMISAGKSPVARDLPPAELAAMTSVARAILNLHETITRN